MHAFTLHPDISAITEAQPPWSMATDAIMDQKLHLLAAIGLVLCLIWHDDLSDVSKGPIASLPF